MQPQRRFRILGAAQDASVEGIGRHREVLGTMRRLRNQQGSEPPHPETCGDETNP